ncbi:MAG: DNA cytosine methyltransferase, partial [Clostridia bacterium]
IETLWASEIEKFPINVSKTHFPNIRHLGDITKINGADIPPVDIICGGSPCQDLSCSKNNREGLKGERSGLFMEQIRIIKEMRNADVLRGRTAEFIRPRIMLWENVPGAFSSTQGEDFRLVLEETAKIYDTTLHIPRPDDGKWKSSGGILLDNKFSLAWRVLNSQWFRISQRRRRIFLIADFAGESAFEILFKQDFVLGDFTQS